MVRHTQCFPLDCSLSICSTSPSSLLKGRRPRLIRGRSAETRHPTWAIPSHFTMPFLHETHGKERNAKSMRGDERFQCVAEKAVPDAASSGSQKPRAAHVRHVGAAIPKICNRPTSITLRRLAPLSFPSSSSLVQRNSNSKPRLKPRRCATGRFSQRSSA